MGDSKKGQVSAEAARVYEDGYVPALFQEWCPRVIETAKIKRGHHIVDVACGAGALSIGAYEHVVREILTFLPTVMMSGGAKNCSCMAGPVSQVGRVQPLKFNGNMLPYILEL